VSAEPRPAFYALRRGGWRDYVTLLHPPYTLWNLSYVAIGAGLAPHVDWIVLALTMLAFLLALGVAAHALDELNGRPLGTSIADRTLVALAGGALVGAAGIGVGVALVRDLWLLAFVAFGVFVVVAYNLELFGGRFHTELWLGVGWGGFTILTAYFAVAGRVRADVLAAATFGTVLILAQRTLSTPVRDLRRRVESVSGTIAFRDGRREPLDARNLIAAPERALKLLPIACVALGAALLLQHI
jgi:hypothetical protein